MSRALRVGSPVGGTEAGGVGPRPVAGGGPGGQGPARGLQTWTCFEGGGSQNTRWAWFMGFLHLR